MTEVVDQTLLDRLILLGGAEFLKKIIAQFLVVAPRELDKIRVACEHNDRAQVSHLTHKLKGSCAVVGATALATVCAQMEQLSGAGDVELAKTCLDRLCAECEAACAALAEIARCGVGAAVP